MRHFAFAAFVVASLGVLASVSHTASAATRPSTPNPFGGEQSQGACVVTYYNTPGEPGKQCYNNISESECRKFAKMDIARATFHANKSCRDLGM